MLYDSYLSMNVSEHLRDDRAREHLELMQRNGDFELFSFRNPGLVSFNIKGVLTAADDLQLLMQVSFGPFTSPLKRVTLVNIVDQLLGRPFEKCCLSLIGLKRISSTGPYLRISSEAWAGQPRFTLVLTALPFVSVDSRVKAIQALRSSTKTAESQQVLPRLPEEKQGLGFFGSIFYHNQHYI